MSKEKMITKLLNAIEVANLNGRNVFFFKTEEGWGICRTRQECIPNQKGLWRKIFPKQKTVVDTEVPSQYPTQGQALRELELKRLEGRAPCGNKHVDMFKDHAPLLAFWW